ncbi:MAG: TdeIII family type II restriction endonuclease [Prochlorotrichaceae cyanobacterium]|jgi:hypothetical protein
MDEEEKIKSAIRRVIEELMERVMNKVLTQDPFIREKHHSSKPLYAALVPDEIFKCSHFERRFTTPFGKAWEQLAKACAIGFHEHCLINHTIDGLIKQDRLRRIQEVLNSLEHKGKSQKTSVTPNWSEEIKYIKKGKGQLIPITVICDLFIDSHKTGKKYAFELKGPLPNSDQTKVSKEKLFKLLAMTPTHVDYAYYALTYNPYGKRENYSWSHPNRWFNMTLDESVLMGNEFWDLIGGEGTYEMFINEVNLLGKGYKERIYREFLGIEPPEQSDINILK